VADDLAMFFGHDGKRQFASVAQCTHDELLRVAGVRCIGEGGNGHGLDGGNVVVVSCRSWMVMVFCVPLLKI
jgi:hypothetical protein